MGVSTLVLDEKNEFFSVGKKEIKTTMIMQQYVELIPKDKKVLCGVFT